MMPVQAGRLHCDLCSVFCMRARACVTFLAQWQLEASGFFLCWLEWRWDGGSSVVSCIRTPPSQPFWPLTMCRMKQAREDVQPANERTGAPRISPASSADWVETGGKNSIYAPRPVLRSHSPILLSPASTTAAVRRDEQTLSGQEWSEIS